MTLFSKSVKYIRKVVSAPKKSVLKFKSLSNIHVYIILPSKRTNSDNLIFKISRGSMPFLPKRSNKITLFQKFGISSQFFGDIHGKDFEFPDF